MISNNVSSEGGVARHKPLYYQGMGDKRYIVKPAYFRGAKGREKLYLVYDTDQPLFKEDLKGRPVMQPTWVLLAKSNDIGQFLARKDIPENEVRLAVARVLSPLEAGEYMLRAF